MSRHFDILIVGAGMVGLSLAALLARSRHAARLRITVVDAGTRPAYESDSDIDLRVSAISLGSARLLDGIGAWKHVMRKRAAPFRGMRVWDAQSSADAGDALRFDAENFAVPELGHIVENALIRDALLDGLQSSAVDLRFATALESIEAREDNLGFDVVLAGGERVAPDLLVGADGAGSGVRREAGIAVRAWQYPQSAFVTHVRPEKDHAQIAWQRFLKDGPIALLPLDDGRVSIVWSSSPSAISAAMDAGDDELGARLTQASDRVLGKLTVAGPRGAFPLKAQHAVRYVEPGLVLVGDAAHSVHPLAGQGANLGFADAAALAEALAVALDANEYPGDLPTLRRYERGRRGANAAMLHFIDSINRLFLANRGPLSGLRRRGMLVFNRSGPIRRRAVEVALGIRL